MMDVIDSGIVPKVLELLVLSDDQAFQVQS